MTVVIGEVVLAAHFEPVVVRAAVVLVVLVVVAVGVAVAMLWMQVGTVSDEEQAQVVTIECQHFLVVWPPLPLDQVQLMTTQKAVWVLCVLQEWVAHIAMDLAALAAVLAAAAAAADVYALAQRLDWTELKEQATRNGAADGGARRALFPP